MLAHNFYIPLIIVLSTRTLILVFPFLSLLYVSLFIVETMALRSQCLAQRKGGRKEKGREGNSGKEGREGGREEEFDSFLHMKQGCL